MTKDECISRVEQFMEGIRNTWVASDGGLTMAGSDVIHFGNVLIAKVREDDFNWIQDVEYFGMDATMQEMFDIVDEWAFESFDAPGWMNAKKE